jgi:hypothetical protein
VHSSCSVFEWWLAGISLFMVFERVLIIHVPPLTRLGSLHIKLSPACEIKSQDDVGHFAALDQFLWEDQTRRQGEGRGLSPLTRPGHVADNGLGLSHSGWIVPDVN